MANGVQITTFKPQSLVLQEYIECIYVFHREGYEHPPFRYLTFPNKHTIVSINQNTRVEAKPDKIQLRFDPLAPLSSELTSPTKKPTPVEYQGPINEVTIYFKPLGLNAFLDHPLAYYEGTNPFTPFKDFLFSMENILLKENSESKIEAIETYWLSRLKGFSHQFLPAALELILNNNEYSLQQISQRFGISRTTLTTHFQQHLLRSPNDFKKINRFRNAIAQPGKDNERTCLTNLSYELEYFDQSHMIKDFKSITGYSPKKFFSKSSSFENGVINWVIL